MYCVGAPATHYFPVSIPYHGCALNMTVQSYLDQLDFGLVACSETVPDAQRIADFVVEDFAAMRKADANLSRPEAVPAPVAAHKPIELAEAKAEPRASKVEKGSALTRNIEALSATTEALLRQLDAALRACRRQSARLEAKGEGTKACVHTTCGQTRSARRRRRASPLRRLRLPRGASAGRRPAPSVSYCSGRFDPFATPTVNHIFALPDRSVESPHGNLLALEHRPARPGARSYPR